MDPALVLFDEPTAELDPAGARMLWRLVRSLAAEGKAVIVATSDLDALPDVADRVVWLEQGRAKKIGPPALLAEDALCAAGLGTAVAGGGRGGGPPPPPPPPPPRRGGPRGRPAAPPARPRRGAVLRAG